MKKRKKSEQYVVSGYSIQVTDRFHAGACSEGHDEKYST